MADTYTKDDMDRLKQQAGWNVEQLADRWGMQHSPHRTEVWFERQCA